MNLRFCLPRVALWMATMLTGSSGIRADDVTIVQMVSQSQTLTVTLGNVPPVFETIVAVPPPPPAAVTPGATLILQTGFSESEATSVEWFRDNVRIAETAGTTLQIVNARSVNSGNYRALIHRGTGDISTDTAAVRVVTPVTLPLLNLSSRATIGPNNRTLICGFVVPASPGKLEESKLVLVRAVGPSLAQYGVTSPLAKPRLRLFDSTGTDITARKATHYTSAAFAQALGAFPLLDGSGEFQETYALPPGAYSLHVDSTDGGQGEVLAEIYDVPRRVTYPFETRD